MKPPDSQKIRVSLTKISNLVKNTYKTKKEGYKADKVLYYKHKIHQLKHSERGVSDLKSSWNLIEKKEWNSAIRSIVEITKTSKEYTRNLKILKNYMQDETIDLFVRKIAQYCLEKNLNKKTLEKNINLMIKYLNDEIKYWVIAECNGMAIQPSKIKIDENILLKKIHKKDLEVETDHWSLGSVWHMGTPSIIVQVKQIKNKLASENDDIFKSRHYRKLQEAIYKVACMLRLFKVGGIKKITIQMFSDSPFIFGFGKTTSHDSFSPPAWSYIKRSEISKLKAFFKVFYPYVPDDIFNFDSIKLTPVAIANNFYEEAVTKNDPIEKRISYVVMGLEALFLEDNMEVSYKLRMRASKFLGLLGMNLFKIKEEIKEGYKIRCKFAHGSPLSIESRKKLEEKYGSLENLVQNLLNYLRLAIILNIFMKKSKKAFAKLIDDSLIDSKKSNTLKKSLNKWKKCIIIE